MSILLLSPLIVKRLPDGRRELLYSLVIEIDGVKFTVPSGTVTDYSSIPQPFAWLMRWSRVDIAGVVHDYLYQTGLLSRKEADHIWRQVARAGQTRANAVQAWLGYAGLRIGGWVTWNRYRTTKS